MDARISKLGLGTVQFGLHYGIANREGKTSEEEVGRILNFAQNAGIRILDTASLYGNSEEVLGRTLPPGSDFQLITKTGHFKKERLDAADAQLLRETFQRSLSSLRAPQLYGLMIHHADDLLVPGGEGLYQAMLDLKSAGKVQKIGVSVYHAGQIDAVLDRFPIELIQLPLNVFDQRLLASGHVRELKQRGIETYARSIFLQGLLLMNPEEIPAHLTSVSRPLAAFQADCARAGTTPLAACLDYILSVKEIDHAVVGVCSEGELQGIVRAAHDGARLSDYATYAQHDENVLNPAKWKK
ncbi:aldo/keto reductase [Desulfolutivibrio sulfoxidireducens]|uniref:aldo/keto reductase n=1 Tax=Desulfolutivibrio sulfoxidireducens TaxID=2773299 RepID=UPI00159D0A7D|nr:aldo/keto reductase [Desulfolutivibrio sulfoxidireducens]QLA14909.1 aryl-alcohol dehydrogenase [Desulfolutivibrio sulfoxidireducens]QLA18475.1 aryl-alcohol dehydrogenase [Desulfolutivibrio sulfoxidireducens]